MGQTLDHRAPGPCEPSPREVVCAACFSPIRVTTLRFLPTTDYGREGEAVASYHQPRAGPPRANLSFCPVHGGGYRILDSRARDAAAPWRPRARAVAAGVR